MTLDEMRARVPVGDRAAYDAAYADAALSSRLGEVLYDLRCAAGLDESALAALMGVAEEDVTRAEEGASLDVAYVRRACAALGVSGAVVLGEHTVDFGGPSGERTGGGGH